MKKISLSAAALAVAMLYPCAGRVQAQVWVPHNSNPEIRTAYRAEALQDANGLLSQWREAWESHDVQALTRIYRRNAILLLPGDTARLQGQRAIEQAMRARLPGYGVVVFRPIDAEPGDDLLYLLQRFEIAAPAPDSAGAPVAPPITGTITMVLQRDDSGWKIRSQVFAADAPAPGREAAASQPRDAAPASAQH